MSTAAPPLSVANITGVLEDPGSGIGGTCIVDPRYAGAADDSLFAVGAMAGGSCVVHISRSCPRCYKLSTEANARFCAYCGCPLEGAR